MAVHELDKIAGTEGIDKTSAQNTSRRIIRDNADFRALKRTTVDTCNPFDGDVTQSNSLINIATGKAASKDTQIYLCSILTTGKEARNKFEEECAANAERFFKPVKNTPCMNFAKENQKKVAPTKHQTLVKVESVRDSFVKVLLLVRKQI